MIIPFSYLHKRKSQTVGTTTDGLLVVNSGVTFSIPEGSVKRYSGIIVRAGGILRISGNTGSWTEIGVVGDLICDGIIECKFGYYGESTPTSGTFTKTSVFGLGALTHTIVQANGGAGGAGYLGGAGGAQNLGRGGGGGGGYNGANGGAGGSNGGSTAYGTGGLGGGLVSGSSGSSTNYAGGAGSGGGGAGGRYTFSFKGSTSYSYGSGGGGGGYRGHHGKGLVLFVDGTVGGRGLITCAGNSGFNGGTGGSYNDQGGGGGGGGAGGCGGKLIIRYRDLGRDIATSVAGGPGGSNGAASTNGTNGANGSAGVAGSLSLSKI